MDFTFPVYQRAEEVCFILAWTYIEHDTKVTKPIQNKKL
jgi:hypothetical protein